MSHEIQSESLWVTVKKEFVETYGSRFVGLLWVVCCTLKGLLWTKLWSLFICFATTNRNHKNCFSPLKNTSFIHRFLVLARSNGISLSHLDKQAAAVKCCRAVQIFSACLWVKAPAAVIRLDFGMNLGLESLNSQCSSNCRERCCWVKNWEGWAGIRKISRWVWGLWEGFWLVGGGSVRGGGKGVGERGG